METKTPLELLVEQTDLMHDCLRAIDEMVIGMGYTPPPDPDLDAAMTRIDVARARRAERATADQGVAVMVERRKVQR